MYIYAGFTVDIRNQFVFKSVTESTMAVVVNAIYKLLKS